MVNDIFIWGLVGVFVFFVFLIYFVLLVLIGDLIRMILNCNLICFLMEKNILYKNILYFLYKIFLFDTHIFLETPALTASSFYFIDQRKSTINYSSQSYPQLHLPPTPLPLIFQQYPTILFQTQKISLTNTNAPRN